MKNKYEVRGEVTAIFLKRKDGTILETIIDTCDLELANSFTQTWYALWDEASQRFYVNGNGKTINGKRKMEKLHRFLMGDPKNKDIDHSSHDGLDNRRSCSLKEVTHAQNTLNKNGANRNNKTGIRGVCWSSKENVWLVQVRVGGKRMFSKRFTDLEEAKRVAIEQYGKLQLKSS